LLERYQAKEVQRVGFATLTCSPSILGDDAEEQFRRVKADRLVARFVRLFREVVGQSAAYLSIMEFHKKSGQVHFHVALDNCGRLSRRSLARLQAWCQRHLGTFDYKYMASDRGVRYAVKYLTKGGYEGLPDWCLDYEGRLRPYSASRGFWHDSKPREKRETQGKERPQHTLRERFDRCEYAGVIGVRETVDEEGQVHRRYGYTWSVAFERVRELAAEVIGDLTERARVQTARWSFLLEKDEWMAVARQVLERPDPGRRLAAGAGP
jgi:hypothetical protein